MHETTSWRHRLQTKFSGTRTNSRRSNTFTMVPDSIDTHKLSSGSKDSLRKVTRLIRRQGGECDWPERRIAAYVGIARGTWRDHRRELEAAGELTFERRRPKGCRLNDTNIMRLGGGGLKIQPQKKSEVLKTTTTAPERGKVESPQVRSELRRFMESRFAQDRKDSQWRREQFEKRAEMWEDAKRCRSQRENERNRMAMRACVGASTLPPPTEEQEREWEASRVELRAREAARIEAKRLEEQRVAEERRIELERLEAHREGCETCRGKGFEMRVIGGVIMQVQCKHGLNMTP